MSVQLRGCWTRERSDDECDDVRAAQTIAPHVRSNRVVNARENDQMVSPMRLMSVRHEHRCLECALELVGAELISAPFTALISTSHIAAFISTPLSAATQYMEHDAHVTVFAFGREKRLMSSVLMRARHKHAAQQLDDGDPRCSLKFGTNEPPTTVLRDLPSTLESPNTANVMPSDMCHSLGT